MATQVKKGAKINFYKFVSPVKVTSKTEDAAVIKAQNSTTSAVNNLGKTLNSLAKVLTEFRDNQVKLLKSFEATAPKKFVPKFNAPQQRDPFVKEEEEQGQLTEAPGWLESIFNLVKDFISLAIVGPALAWLSDPENRQTIVDTLETIGKIFEIIGGFVTDRVKGAIDGLYDFFKEDATWWERLTGFFKGFGNFALLMIGLRWITNPAKMVKDVGRVINTFWKVLKALGNGLTKRGLGKGRLPNTGGGKRKGGLAKALLTTGVAVGVGYGINQMTQGGEPEQKAKGGKLKQRASGGFINGPMSGYPVSLDGGKSTSFIGHGLEYVAQKSSGGFVVPINTPATKNNPGLMGSRMNEASRMGYDLGGMFSGFDAGGEINNQGKPASLRGRREKTRLEKTVKAFGGLLPAFAQGGEMKKMGDGARLVNAPGGMCVTGVLNTAQANGAKIGAPHVAAGRDPNNPRGLMSQAVTDFGWTSVNIGTPQAIKSPYGNFRAKVMNKNQWKGAVKGNKIPSGSLIFSTRHSSWDYSGGSSGNDAAIAKKGGRELWSGHWQRVVDGVGMVYGNATNKVVALVHPRSFRGGYDGSTAPGNGGGSTPMALSGRAKQLIGSDTAFLDKVKKLSHKYQIHPSDLLGKMASESGFDPAADNGTHVGLIQFSADSAAAVGTTQAALKRMSRAEQMTYVEKYFDYWKLPKGASAGHLYTISYLPAFAKESADYVLAKRGGFTDKNGHHPSSWYDHNKGLDMNNDGSITIAELGERIEKKKREFGITGGGGSGSYSGDSSNIASSETSAIGPPVPTNPMEALQSLQSGIFSAFGMDTGSSSSSGPASAPPPVSQAAGEAKLGNKSATTGQGTDKLGPAHMRPGKGAGTPGAGASGDSTSDTKAGSTAGASNVGGTSPPPAVPPAASSSGASAASPTGSTSSSSLVTQTGRNLKARQMRQQRANQNLAAVSAVAAQQNQKVQALAAATAQPAPQAKSGKPKVVSAGGGSSRDLISQLNSTNNPMRSNF